MNVHEPANLKNTKNKCKMNVIFEKNVSRDFFSWAPKLVFSNVRIIACSSFLAPQFGKFIKFIFHFF